MSNALTVQQRHISLPECALFAPTELKLSYTTSQDEFLRIGKVLSSVDQASDLWACDFALHGMRRWGKDDGIVLAAKATGLSQFFLRRCARIAERFTPEKRYPVLTRSHYRRLLPFDAAQIDAWLPTVILERHSAASLYALAVEKFGKPEKSHKQRARHKLNISDSLWARLAPHAPSNKVVPLIELILEEWLANRLANPADAQAVALASDKLRKARKKERDKERREEAKKEGGGSTESDVPGVDDAQPRAGRGKFKTPGGTLHVQWAPCFAASADNATEKRLKDSRADRFATEEIAREAEQQHFEARGYHEAVTYCEVCDAWHVKHVYAAEMRSSEATNRGADAPKIAQQDMVC
jgi:hypothetical protein